MQRGGHAGIRTFPLFYLAAGAPAEWANGLRQSARSRRCYRSTFSSRPFVNLFSELQGDQRARFFHICDGPPGAQRSPLSKQIPHFQLRFRASIMVLFWERGIYMRRNNIYIVFISRKCQITDSVYRERPAVRGQCFEGVFEICSKFAGTQ